MTDPTEAGLTGEEQALAEEYAAYAHSGEHEEFEAWDNTDGLEPGDATNVHMPEASTL